MHSRPRQLVQVGLLRGHLYFLHHLVLAFLNR